MRTPVLAGNWKMNKTVAEARALCSELVNLLSGVSGPEIVVCPPFTALYAVQEVIKGTNISLGAQDVYWEPSGAYTGEISLPMLIDIGVRYVIVGHSERRGYFNETDADVNKKAKAILAADLIPIVCVGETLAQREAQETKAVVKKQIEAAFDDIEVQDARKVVVAYEPIWAIGTGRTATGEDANEVISYIRELLRGKYGKTADAIRIQYGGSVKPGNIKELMSQIDIDGALVGGASLDAKDFAAIVKYK